MSARKIAFKLPPTTIRDATLTQQARRSKALEEQKLRRAQKFDSSRQLDVFADLTLSGEDEDAGEDEDPSVLVPSMGVGSFVTAMKEQPDMTESLPEIKSSTDAKGTTKKKRRRRAGRGASKPSKWADKCMYAELLEMVDPEAAASDGELPSDLETDWVAVAPVPVGKRCLAVTYHSSGVAGVAPNTALHSRLLGKTLIARFPSALPPSTILDCILDVNWRDNGILHVLDVIKWKGQDVGGCEARFRFWWRDTRLAEISQSTPSMAGYQVSIPLPMVSVQTQPTAPTTPTLSRYQFTYPVSFLPIPYFTDTSLSSFYERIIPLARENREVAINVPVFNAVPQDPLSGDGGGMDVDMTNSHIDATGRQLPNPPLSIHETFSFAFVQRTTVCPGESSTLASCGTARTSLSSISSPMTGTPVVASVQVQTRIQSDGLLLYVAEASYEAGMSPLSNWIPIVGYEKTQKAGETKEEVKRERESLNGESKDKGGAGPLKKLDGNNGPLDLFEWLVERRLNMKGKAVVKSETGMDMDV